MPEKQAGCMHPPPVEGRDATAALALARAHQRLRAHRRLQHTLAHADCGDVFQQACCDLRELFDARAAAILIQPPGARVPVSVYSSGLDAKSAAALDGPRGHASGGPMVADLACAGIAQGRVCVLPRADGRAYDAEDLAELADVAAQLARLRENALHAEALRESELRLRQVTENIREVFFLEDAQMERTFYVSPGYEEIWGRSVGELYANPRAFVESIHPDDRERALAQIAAGRAAGRYEMEYRIVRPDGKVRTIRARGYPVHDEQGRTYRFAGVAEDITEQRQTEHALEASEQYSRALFDGNPLPLWVFDVRTLRFVDVNEAACRKYGWPRAEFLTLTLRDIRPPEDVPRLEATIARTSSDRYRHLLRSRHRLRDGRLIDVDIAGIDIVLDGRPCVFCCPIDVTERLEAQSQLAESERRFSNMLGNVQQVAVMLDTRGVLTYCNDYLLELTGWKREEVIGRSWFDVFIAPERGDMQVLFARLVADMPGAWHNENEILTRAGARRMIQWNNSVLRSPQGEVIGIASLGVDVTEARRAEEALRESEERLRLVLESTSEAIYGVDLEGRCILANPACARMLGYASPDDFEGLQMHELVHHSYPDGTPMPVEDCRIYRAFRIGEGVHVDDEVFWRADGTSFPAEYWSYPIRRDGEVIGSVVAFLDITERKRTEQAIRDLNADLERRVAERTVDLEAANQELQAFDYSVAHDLRAPLGRMRGFASALLQDAAGKLDATGRDYLERIARSADHMDEIVGDLLQLSLVSRHDLHRDRVDVCALARTVFEGLRRHDPLRRVELALPPALFVEGDMRLLRIAFDNLIANAWKFTAKRAAARIEVGEAEGALFVSDDGAGFDPARADKLFAPFQRLHAQADFPGTGIGLAIVQRIVRRHGGRIWAEGAVERGATFRFSLAHSPGRNP